MPKYVTGGSISEEGETSLGKINSPPGQALFLADKWYTVRTGKVARCL